MAQRVDYYFDFMSPYAYLGCSQIPRLIATYDAAFVGHAFDMWAARLAAGNTGPSNRDMPARARVLMADVARWAQRYELPLATPKGFDTARLNRGFTVAQKYGAEVKYMTGAFHRLWGLGGDPLDNTLLIEAAADAGLDGEAVLRESDTPEAKSLYAAGSAEAQARGVFGAPMFAVGDQMFWGNDRLDFVETLLR